MEYVLSKVTDYREDQLRINVKQKEYINLPDLNRLNVLRNSIDKIPIKDWKRIRWFINYYDFIVKDPVINRAFYKYWEIINKYNLLDPVNKVLHLAEAPGGFIQGSNLVFKKRNVKSKKYIDCDGFECISKPVKDNSLIFTMSLDKKNPKYVKYNLPSYNTDILKSNVHICYGETGTGDICNLNNFIFLKDDLSKHDIKKLDLVTGDGGFDEGDDFNNKEQLHYKLIIYELYYGLMLSKVGGSFLIKVFDIFTDLSIEFLYLLSIHYSEVYIYKPYTSRPTNSEKYIICKGFKGINDTMEEYLTSVLKVVDDFDFYNNTLSIVDVPLDFYNSAVSCNNKLVDYQCNYLEKALNITEEIYKKRLVEIRDKKLKRYNEWKKAFNFTH